MKDRDAILLEQAYSRILIRESNDMEEYKKNSFGWQNRLKIGQHISIRRYNREKNPDDYDSGVVKEIKNLDVVVVNDADGKLRTVNKRMTLPFLDEHAIAEIKNKTAINQENAKKKVESMIPDKFYKTKDGEVLQFKVREEYNGRIDYELFGSMSNSSIKLNPKWDNNKFDVGVINGLVPATEEESKKAEDRIKLVHSSMADFYKDGVTGS